MKDSGSLLSFLYPSLSSAQSQALLQTSVPAPHTPIVFTLPSGSDSLVYFQEQTEKRTRKKFVFYQCVCVCVCVPVCEQYFWNSKARASITSVE